MDSVASLAVVVSVGAGSVVVSAGASEEVVVSAGVSEEVVSPPSEEEVVVLSEGGVVESPPSEEELPSDDEVEPEGSEEGVVESPPLEGRVVLPPEEGAVAEGVVGLVVPGPCGVVMLGVLPEVVPGVGFRVVLPGRVLWELCPLLPGVTAGLDDEAPGYRLVGEVTVGTVDWVTPPSGVMM